MSDAPVPRWFEPMKAVLTDEPFSDAGWIFERKLDGVRCLAIRDGDELRLLSRTRRELNRGYPELVDALAGDSCERFAADGEIVAFERGVTSFSRLQGRLLHAGKVGTGFDHATLGRVGARLRELETDSCAFAGVAPVPRGTHWVRPRLVAQIGFSEWTRDGRLRHPRYLGLRDDKRARDVVREVPT